MDFIELAKCRYSSRKYKNRPIEEEKLQLVLEAGRIAPSAANYQPWIFIIIKNENVDKVRACYDREWFKTAPVYIVVCSDSSQSWKRKDGKDHADIDASIAADHMTFAATSTGLATCWVCNFEKEKLVEALNLSAEYDPTVILSIGYPDDVVNLERHTVKRKKLDDIVFYERFEKK